MRKLTICSARCVALHRPRSKRSLRYIIDILSALFLGFSYGFRPGRGTHDALDALWVGINSRKVNFILDADIQSFFDTVSHVG